MKDSVERAGAMKWNSIYFPRLPRNKKPEEAYRYLEEINVENCAMIDLFGRRRNARAGWTLVGKEV